MFAAPRRLLATLALALLVARPAAGSPIQYLPVGDPLEAELRILDLYDPSAAPGRLAFPHLHSRPVRFADLMGEGPAYEGSGARRIAVTRLERFLARDASGSFAPANVPGATPRWLQYAWPGDQRVEVSVGLEGSGTWTDAPGEDRTSLTDGSGAHVRATLQVDRWIAHTHMYAGKLADVTSYSDPLISGSDVALSTEDSWLAYSGRSWDLQGGRTRWHWGPGDEGSLLLSKSAAALGGMMLHVRIEPLKADAFIFNASTRPAAGEQLAAHRLEWQPWDGVRLGLAEAARYHSDGWQALYVVGVIPYSIVQRLYDQDEPDSADALRNNVLVALDASVRIADGSRAYFEFLIDDLQAKTSDIPNKLGWQLGWDGTGDVRGTRVSWNAEYTRLARYVYTSYYGRVFESQGIPLGFPTGPDAERFRARVAWDPDADWQVSLVAARTVKGENYLDEPFVPGSPVPPAFEHEGIAETARTLDGAVRWWPAGGVDVTLGVGHEWRDDAGHVAGASTAAWRGTLALRLWR